MITVNLKIVYNDMGMPVPIADPPHQAFAGYLHSNIQYAESTAADALAWAAEPDSEPRSGNAYTVEFWNQLIHVTSEYAESTNPYRSCSMPLQAFIDGVEMWRQAVIEWHATRTDRDSQLP